MPGDAAFRSVFCGPLRKKWVYSRYNASEGGSPHGCGRNPRWERLRTPEQLPLAHYRDASGGSLPPARGGVPLPTDCLWGVATAGEALLQSAYPQCHGGEVHQQANAVPACCDEPADPVRIFSDYLLEGVELLKPRDTIHGTIHSDATHAHALGYGARGDRYFEPPAPWACAAQNRTGLAPEQTERLCTHTSERCHINYYRDGSDDHCQVCGYSSEYSVCKRCPRGASTDDTVYRAGLDACSCSPGFYTPTGTLNAPCEPCPTSIHGEAMAVCAGGLAPPQPTAGHWLDLRYANTTGADLSKLTTVLPCPSKTAAMCEAQPSARLRESMTTV